WLSPTSTSFRSTSAVYPPFPMPPAARACCPRAATWPATTSPRPSRSGFRCAVALSPGGLPATWLAGRWHANGAGPRPMPHTPGHQRRSSGTSSAPTTRHVPAMLVETFVRRAVARRPQNMAVVACFYAVRDLPYALDRAHDADGLLVQG